MACAKAHSLTKVSRQIECTVLPRDWCVPTYLRRKYGWGADSCVGGHVKEEDADKWRTYNMFIRQMPCMLVKITFVLSLLDSTKGRREEKERRLVIGRELF